MIQKLEEFLSQAEAKLIADARTEPLDDLRRQAGLIQGLRIALQLAQRNEKELNNGQ